MTDQLRRRELLAAGGSASVLALAGCSGLLGSDSVDGWPMYQHDPAHTGVHPSAEGPGGDLDEQWVTSARSLAEEHGDDVSFPTVSPPVVSDGTMFVTLTSARRTFGASLVALDVADGSQQWQTVLHEDFAPTASGPLPQPTVLGDVVVASLSGVAPGPSVVAVDADSGEVQWRNSEQMTATPGTAWDGSVAFGFSTAYALARDGSLTWEYSEGEDPPYVPVGSPPTITDDGVFVPTQQGLHALDHDGNQEWTRDLAFESELFRDPTRPTTPVAGDSLYVTTANVVEAGDGRLLALDPSDGTTRWEFKPEFDAERRERLMREFSEQFGRTPPLGVGLYVTPALHDGTLYALGRTLPEEDRPRPVPRLFAVDADSGERQWATRLPNTYSRVPPVIAGGTVYVATEVGVVAIDAESGERLEAAELDDFVSGFALDADRLFAATPNEIVALGP